MNFGWCKKCMGKMASPRQEMGIKLLRSAFEY